MTYDFTKLKNQIKEAEEWLKKEFFNIRTGQAAPQILDGVLVEAYGTRSPMNQVASVSVSDARSLLVTPFDPSLVKAIEKAITAADLGLGLRTDEKGVRVFFPELTSERRTTLLKLAKDKVEAAKVTIKNARQETWDDIQKKEKEGGMGEDERFRFKAEMEKMVEGGNSSLTALLERKEKEINQ